MISSWGWLRIATLATVFTITTSGTYILYHLSNKAEADTPTPEQLIQQPVFNLSIPAACAVTDVFKSEIIEKFPDEKPVIMGKSERIDTDGTALSVPLMILFDSKAKTFTIVEQLGLHYCIIASGTDAVLLDTRPGI